MTTFNSSGPSIDEQTISTFETRIDHTLPKDYRDFLSDTNGGIPTPSDVAEPSQGVVGIRWFFSLDDSRAERSLEEAVTTWHGRHPESMMPIALCDGSNVILLTLDGPDGNGVHYWEHDGEAEEGEPARTDNLTQVADSFTALLDTLHDWDPRQDPRYRDIAGGTGTGDHDFIPTFD